MVLKKGWGKNIKMAAYIGMHMVYAMKLERKKLIKDDEGHKTKWERHSKNFFAGIVIMIISEICLQLFLLQLQKHPLQKKSA